MVFEPETIAVLRAIFDEVCKDIPASDSETRIRVATVILEKAKEKQATIDQMKCAARRASFRAAR